MGAMTIDPEAAEVKASGGVVCRDGKVALVHRPRYDDWSFPKGKLDKGETWEDAALREVEEEIGLRCTLVRELPPTSYRDPKGRAEEASSMLSYEHDHALLVEVRP
jgi:8-oxo-dGTP diphosphatase